MRPLNEGEKMHPAIAVVKVICTIALAALSLTACSYKTFAEQEQSIKAEWAEVEAALRRRDSVIPSLVETVRKYAPGEEAVYRATLDSRARLQAAKTNLETIEAANRQSVALEQLQTIIDKHPEMKGDASFGPMMSELTAAQNAVAVGRMRYNARVQQYNISRRRFPGMVTGQLFFDRYPFFEVPPPPPGAPKAEGEREP